MATQSLTASNLNGGFALIGSLCFPAKAGDTVEIKATANADGGEDQLLLFFDDQQGSFDSFGTSKGNCLDKVNLARPVCQVSAQWVLVIRFRFLISDFECPILSDAGNNTLFIPSLLLGRLSCRLLLLLLWREEDEKKLMDADVRESDSVSFHRVVHFSFFYFYFYFFSLE